MILQFKKLNKYLYIRAMEKNHWKSSFSFIFRSRSHSFLASLYNLFLIAPLTQSETHILFLFSLLNCCTGDEAGAQVVLDVCIYADAIKLTIKANNLKLKLFLVQTIKIEINSSPLLHWQSSSIEAFASNSGEWV